MKVKNKNSVRFDPRSEMFAFVTLKPNSRKLALRAITFIISLFLQCISRWNMGRGYAFSNKASVLIEFKKLSELNKFKIFQLK